MLRASFNDRDDSFGLWTFAARCAEAAKLFGQGRGNQDISSSLKRKLRTHREAEDRRLRAPGAPLILRRCQQL